jgi:two-component system, NarL family, nitrate/nitrite response regulator NarL
MKLTTREFEILVGHAEGLTDTEIANRLGLTPNTVKTYSQMLRAKLGARNRTHAVSIGYQRGLLATSFKEVAA